MSPNATPANNLYQLLKALLAAPDSRQWVSATVLTKYGSSYRKPGAMMLVSPLGQTLGLISGGCLESDIVLRARRVLEYGAAEFVIYDSMEDGNIAAELGLGCNGRIGVLVEEVSDQVRDLYRLLLDRMTAGLSSWLVHAVGEGAHGCGVAGVLDENLATLKTLADWQPPRFHAHQAQATELIAEGEHAWSLVPVKPPVRLLIAGGGVDARPMADLAARLGWRVTVADHRTVNARRQDFPLAESLLATPPGATDEPVVVDAAIIMTHNLDMDAAWLRYCQGLPGLRYLGLLGPVSRREEVLSLAGIPGQSTLPCPLHGPMGIDIGGDLPESVALSAIAQCHQVLAGAGLV